MPKHFLQNPEDYSNLSLIPLAGVDSHGDRHRYYDHESNLENAHSTSRSIKRNIHGRHHYCRDFASKELDEKHWQPMRLRCCCGSSRVESGPTEHVLNPPDGPVQRSEGKY